MGFKIKHYDSFFHTWVSKPMRPLEGGQPWTRAFAPRRYAEDFPTRAQAEAEIEVMRALHPNSLRFEIVDEQPFSPVRASDN